MKRLKVLILLLVFITVSTSSNAQGLKGRELFGIRIGGIASRGELKRIFGAGSELELYFVEGLTPWLGVNISFSSHNLGYSNDIMKNIEFLGSKMDVKLNIYSATVAMAVYGGQWHRLIPSIEAGGGLYAITAILPFGFYEGRITDNQAGLYAGTTIHYRLARKLMLDASFKYHYIFSGGDMSHTIYFYTQEDRTTIYQFTVGVTFFTG